MKRPIKNVFAKHDYNCFGCSPYNSTGLQLKFYEIDDYIESEWITATQYEGYPGAVHGGIISTMIDEIAAWVMYIKARCAGVTSRMSIRYRKPVNSLEEKIILRGKLREVKRNLCYVDVWLLNANDEICAEGEVIYFAFSSEKSIEECFYPEDYNSFFEDDNSSPSH